MARRVSSREDVFVSAADLFLLLTFLFLTLALRVVHSSRASDQARVELPVVGSSGGGAGKEHLFTVRRVQIAENVCRLEVIDSPEGMRKEIPAKFDVGCGTPGFGANPLLAPADLGAIAAQLPENKRFAVVECARQLPEQPGDANAAALACAQAQWWLISAGFRTFAKVNRGGQ